MSAINYIKSQHDACDKLVHASNILTRFSDGKCIKELDLIAAKYEKFLKFNMQNCGFDEAVIRGRVAAANEYYGFLHENKFDNLFPAQTKFRPTILEEFIFFLFRDYIAHIKQIYNDIGDKIHGGSAKAYANLFFTSPSMREFVQNPSIKINEKDQDFAIYRTIDIQIEQNAPAKINVPVVAIENKTYIDKAVLDSIMAIADRLKAGNPYLYFAAVSETYDVGFDVDPFYSNIDQIYVLRKSKRKAPFAPIDAGLVARLFNDIKTHIERPWSDVENKMKKDGLVM